MVGVGVDDRRPTERNPQRDLRKQRRDEVPEQDLHQQRGAPEEPDVEPAGPRDEPVGRQAHDGQDDPQEDPDDHRHHGQPDGLDDAPHDPRVEQIVADDVPAGSAG